LACPGAATVHRLNDSAWQYLYAGFIALLAAGLLYHHWQIIVAPVPLDLYEGTMPLITGIIAEGNNPYTRAFQPQTADVYPPLYNLLVAPLSLLFGNTFQLHRSVSAVFIVASSALCGFTAIRNGASRLNGMAVTLLMYAALLFYGTPVSSTNAPGVALFLAGLLVPWFCRFGTGSLVFSLLCGLLSFYTKQYFILGMAILCLYLFLCVSMRRALLLGTAYATLLLASLVAVHYTSPYYLDNTLFAPAAAVRGLQTWEILGLQVRFFLGVYAGLLVAMSIAGFLLPREKGACREWFDRPSAGQAAGLFLVLFILGHCGDRRFTGPQSRKLDDLSLPVDLPFLVARGNQPDFPVSHPLLGRGSPAGA
jgi:hypothetical protein